jgi:transposase
MRTVQWQRLRGEQPGRARWMKGTRFALRRGPARRSERDRAIIDELAEVNHELYRAHLWCDQLRASLQEPDPEAASCELAALAEAAPTLGHHLFTRLGASLSRFRQLIINTVHHRITNGRLEGANSTITLLVHRARGFRRVENLEALIHLVLGRVDVALPT